MLHQTGKVLLREIEVEIIFFKDVHPLSLLCKLYVQMNNSIDKLVELNNYSQIKSPLQCNGVTYKEIPRGYKM